MILSVSYDKFFDDMCKEYLSESFFAFSPKVYKPRKCDQYYEDLENKRVNDKYRKLIKWVQFNEKKNATTVKWYDDTYTVVRTAADDEFDPYIGVAMCMAKKLCGNRAIFNEIITKWGDTYKPEETKDYEKLAEDYGVKKYNNTVKFINGKKVIRKDK